MRRRHPSLTARWSVRLVLILGILLPLASISLAQSGGGYDLAWSTVDAGGGTLTGAGGYTLGGSAGQPEAQALSGGGYTLYGGFWGGGWLPVWRSVYLPIVMRQH